MSMTESEAIEWLAEDTSPTLIHIAEMKKENPMVYINEAVKVACDALSEIQQYRAIGTVEQLEWCKDASHWKEMYKEKLEQYEAIGTVSEFRELKEKVTAKKPNDKFEFSPCPRCGSRETLGDGFCYVCGTILD